MIVDESANLKFINNRPVQYGAGVISRNSVATYCDINGVLRTAQPNEARPNYVDGEWRGLLIEYAVTQYLPDQVNFSSGWTGSLVAGLVSGRPSPDGGTSGFLATRIAAGGDITKSVTAPATTNRTISFFVQPVTATTFSIVYGSTTVTFNTVTDTVTGNGRIEKYGSFFRLSMTVPGITSATNLTLNVGSSVGQSAVIAFGNFVNGNPSSYIPGMTVRQADVYLPSVTQNRLAYTNVPVLDATDPDESTAVVWVAGTYADRDRVIYDGFIYESNQAANTTRPDIGAAETPAKWTIVSPSNRWKCLDMQSGTDDPTERPDYIEYIIMLGMTADTIALHGIDASDLTVQVFNEGQVTTVNNQLISTDGIDSYWEWFYRQRINQNQATQNILAPAGSMIRVLLTGDSGAIKLGKLVVGQIETVGVTLESLPIENTDFSVVTRNAWGKAFIREGRVVDLKRYSCKVDSSRVAYLNEQFKKLGRTSTSWIGIDDVDATILFGFKESVNFDYFHGGNQPQSDCEIIVIGL